MNNNKVLTNDQDNFLTDITNKQNIKIITFQKENWKPFFYFNLTTKSSSKFMIAINLLQGFQRTYESEEINFQYDWKVCIELFNVSIMCEYNSNKFSLHCNLQSLVLEA